VFPEFPELTDEQRNRLQRHHDLLLQWNRKLNLVSSRSEKELLERHYYESLFLGRHLTAGQLRIADIGSGAGFPGFVVAIQRPESSITLIESHQRKAVFLREASRDVPNIRVLSQRAEDVGDRFDWVISRAVRYDDIRRVITKLAPRAALLTGDVSPSDLPGFDWQEPIRLPWGEHRMLFVSRETGEAQ
jgi:16S rRNA (guanine(527)-N(7))-methyltransferase RsmG